jgi:hypothetical protein
MLFALTKLYVPVACYFCNSSKSCFCFCYLVEFVVVSVVASGVAVVVS